MRKLCLAFTAFMLSGIMPAYSYPDMNQQPWLVPAPVDPQQQQLEYQKERLEQNARQRLGIPDYEWAQMPEQQRFAIRQDEERIERGQPPAPPPPPPVAIAPVYEQPYEAFDNHPHHEHHRAIVECEVSGGNGRFDQGWRPLEPLRFSIAEGERQTIDIRRADKQRFTSHFWVGFNPSEGLEFCADQNTGERYKHCRRHAVTPAFERGYSAPLSIPDAIDGATLHCRFAERR